MKAKAALAAALRKAADKMDPPTKEKSKPGLILKPVDIDQLDGFERPGPLLPLPDYSGWGYYL